MKRGDCYLCVCLWRGDNSIAGQALRPDRAISDSIDLPSQPSPSVIKDRRGTKDRLRSIHSTQHGFQGKMRAVTSLRFETTQMYWRLLLFVLLVTTPKTNADVTGEFCENEDARLECNRDEVIIVTEASYGRMEASRCIQRNYGYLGCSADVLGIVDRKCSGRRSCQFRIPDPDLGTADNRCPGDLKPYLFVKFTCNPVAAVPNSACGSLDGALLTSQSGLIASVTTQETTVGSTDCAWRLHVQPGQRINITLFDFGRKDHTEGICHAYAIIREREHSQSNTVCDGIERMSTAYITRSNNVEVRILMTKQIDKYFLLKYQAIGCPDIPSSSSLAVSRKDDVINLKCKTDDKSWSMHCKDNKWKGHWQNCTSVAVGAISQGDEEWGIVTLPFGWSIVVIIIIALTIGVIFMVVGLACLRTRKRPLREAGKDPQYYTGFVTNQDLDKQSRGHVKRELPWPPNDDPTYAGENEYEYISDFSPPPPPPTNADYARQNVDKLKMAEAPKYFVLDPGAREFTPNACGTLPASNRYVINMSCDGTHMVSPPTGSLAQDNPPRHHVRTSRQTSVNKDSHGSNQAPTQGHRPRHEENHLSI